MLPLAPPLWEAPFEPPRVSLPGLGARYLLQGLAFALSQGLFNGVRKPDEQLGMWA